MAGSGESFAPPPHAPRTTTNSTAANKKGTGRPSRERSITV